MLKPYLPNKSMVLTFLLIVFSVAISKKSKAQTFNIVKDLQQLDELKHNKTIRQNKRAYIYKGQKASFKTINPISLSYGGLLFLYQNSISQHFSADCLYHPTCSDFSKQCVHDYGLIKGGLLTFDRLNRCNRIAGADLHSSQFNAKTQHCSDPISKYK